MWSCVIDWLTESLGDQVTWPLQCLFIMLSERMPTFSVRSSENGTYWIFFFGIISLIVRAVCVTHLFHIIWVYFSSVILCMLEVGWQSKIIKDELVPLDPVFVQMCAAFMFLPFFPFSFASSRSLRLHLFLLWTPARAPAVIRWEQATERKAVQMGIFNRWVLKPIVLWEGVKERG